MKKVLCMALMVLIIFSFYTASAQNIDWVLKDTGNYLLTTVPEPSVSSVGGEWLIVGLARSGAEISDSYFESYYNRVVSYVKEHRGVLHERKYTEYSRVILALTAIGKNPANVAGYNLLAPLGDFDKVVLQGLNGPVWALIALDSGNYDIPYNSSAKTQATRSMYIRRILEREIQGGGWALNQKQTQPDVDITAMALTALAPYKNESEVADAINRGLNILSAMQEDNGGYTSYNNQNSESSAQVLTALSSLGISYDDSRFVKNGNTIKDSLLSFYREGGGFAHTGGESDLMATEQAFYALVASQRCENGVASLFNMANVVPFSTKVLDFMQEVFERINLL